MIHHSFWFYAITFFSIILARYFLMAGFAYWLFYLRKAAKPILWPSSVNQLTDESVLDDIRLSVISTTVFAVATAAVMTLHEHGLTRLYGQIQGHDWWYLIVSYLAVLILQDGYFYATHRLLHHPALFPWLHQGHHRSRPPTPWTSFAFDPLEALLQALFLVIIVLVVPLHFITVMAVLTTMTVWAIVNHLGLDHLPQSFPHHWLGKWVIGPAHHSCHHLRHRMHFGLYFTFWDRVFDSEDPRYALAVRQTMAGPMGHRQQPGKMMLARGHEPS
jgi:lathosterol oxidase